MKRADDSPTARLVGKVLNLADLVQYHDGAVVSRTVVDKKAGTVTIFAFDAGEGLSEHTAPFDALVYVFEGQVEITIAGEAMTASQGEMVIMPADKPHALRALSRFKMLLTMIREKA